MSPSNKPAVLDAQDVKELMQEIHKENTALIREVTAAVAILEQAKNQYDTSWKAIISHNISHIVIAFIALCIVAGAIFIPSIQVEFGEWKLSKPAKIIEHDIKNAAQKAEINKH